LAQGKDTQGAYSMSEVTAVRLNAPLHQHKTYSESFYVLAGHLTVYVDGKTHRLGPGSFLLVPPGTPHTMGNTDTQPVRFLITVSPSSLFDQQMAEQAELTKTLKPDHPDYRKRMGELYQKYDMEILGPSPIKP
jgi:quercetin dioxygenase-like cupin family protein